MKYDTKIRSIFVEYLHFYFIIFVYLGDVKKFKAILKAMSAVSRLVRMRLAQSCYGSGLSLPVYHRPNKVLSLSIYINFFNTFLLLT